jgi:hypothetical protein
MKRISVIATVDWAQIILRCLVTDVVIPGVAGLIKTSLCAPTTGCWFRQQRCLR